MSKLNQLMVVQARTVVTGSTKKVLISQEDGVDEEIQDVLYDGFI